MATIAQLQDELETLLKQVPAFNQNSFSIFDVQDFGDKTNLQSLPIVGVAYDGATVVEWSPLAKAKSGANAGSPVDNSSHGVAMITLQFTILMAIQYHYTGQDDTKPQAMALLDQMRSVVLGYRGVNGRPWKFIGEKPEPVASGGGIVFYSQVWQTVVPIVGNFNNV